MNYKRESLVKLMKLIEEISNQPGNEWFKEELKIKLLASNYSTKNNSDHLNEIYEYCLQKIIKEHADQFYNDFKLYDIKPKLVSDFIRMEKFRRDDNFEDFCLAAFQQLELIVNTLIESDELKVYLAENLSLPAVLYFDKSTDKFLRKGNQTIGTLIFQKKDHESVDPNFKFFNQRLRAVLYFYYYNKEIKYNTNLFEDFYSIGNFLYQGRNLNHRGSQKSEYQQNIIVDLISNQYKFYFKFLGFMEDFISTINKNI